MNRSHPLSSTAVVLSCALAATAMLAPHAASAAGAIKAAYVEEVIPSHTFNAEMSLSTNLRAVGPGPGTAVFGITSLTFTNTDSSRQLVFFAPAAITGNDCSVNSAVLGAVISTMYVVVPANSTLHMTYPTPYIVSPWQGTTCFGAKLVNPLHDGDVLVNVVGVLN
jgi:hypothetical protein